MENIFLAFVILLIIFGVIHLIVGVGNDAVNFLFSAIGSKTASFWLITTTASAGIIVGSMFSESMMDIARHGIFKPQSFVFYDIMIIFLAVMLTNIILLDVFNTFGFPTSTSVSLIFELLGATFAISFLKIRNSNILFSEFINFEQVTIFIFGILISIIIAFLAGLIFQFIARIIFSFDLTKTYKNFASIWGAFCIVAIIYFIFKAELNQSILDNNIFINFFSKNKIIVVFLSFIFFTIFFNYL